MKQRVLTAVIGLPLLIFIVWAGNWILAAGTAAVTIVALKEYVDAVNKGEGPKLSFLLLALLSGIILVIMKLDFYALPFAVVIGFMGVMAYEVLSSTPSYIRACQSLFFLIYIPFILGFIMLFDTAIGGEYTIWMCFIAPFATDTFAYFGGSKLGGKKLTKISPNKTISGSICGLLACIAALLIYGWFLNRYAAFNLPLYYYGILGFFTSLAGQIGDISASLIKRTYDVKDFGKILPGHGGILDRFDSVIFTIPVVYIFTYYFLG